MRFSALIFIAAYSAVLNALMLIAPVISGKLAEDFGLGPAQTGAIFSVELGCFSLATIPAYLWLRRLNLRQVTIVCTVIVIVGNIVSGFVGTYSALLLARLVTSLAAGSIVVILLSRSGKAHNPSRAFGVFVVSQLVMGALILAVFPTVFAEVGSSAVYWSLAGLALLCLPATALLDGEFLRRDRGQGPADAARPSGRSVLPFVLGLGAVLLFYVALSGVWTFMAAVADVAGTSPDAVSRTLSVATLAGIASALFASLRGDTPRRRLYLAVGYLGMAVSVLLLVGAPGLWRFAVAAVVFKFVWTLILPYLLSTLADLGSGGQVMNTTNLMIGSGLALGPLISGSLIESTGGFGAMLLVSTVGVIVSGLLVMVVHPRRADT
ncbi:MFS transporter [Actinocorallia glomerata]|uniref:MFS transporter n=2 Tax=Actinomycetes TaxID=1760 RepID=A0ABP6LVR3_9MICC